MPPSATTGLRNAVRDLLPMGVRRWLRRARTATHEAQSRIEHQRLALRAARAAWLPLARPGEQPFRCNLCGAHGSAAPARLGDREAATCEVCGSSLRHRALIAALQLRLCGEVRPLRTLARDRRIVGLGMSDVHVYAQWLQRKFAYDNTFFHKAPRLDIQDPGREFLGRHDFVICSDVLEHVAPPVATAFRNLHGLLKPGGMLAFTVPYAREGETCEHFPELHAFRIEGEGPGRRLLNTTRDGRRQAFGDLRFHGGDGDTLEMRIFALPGLLRLLAAAGFRDLQVHDQPLPQWGIVPADGCSLPITAVAG
jgi:SAM-dependent methyltransferase